MDALTGIALLLAGIASVGGWLVYAHQNKIHWVWRVVNGLVVLFVAEIAMVMMFARAGGAEQTGASLSATPQGLSDADKQIAAKALQAFVDQCPNMAVLSPDIEGATLSWGQEESTDSRHRGWRKPIELIVKFRNKPADRRLIEWKAFGNTCYYTMGGGLRPGWSTGKGACAQVCGVAKTNGDFFAGSPAFKFLDDPDTPAYKQALAKAKTDWESEIAKAKVAAEKGDIGAINNVAFWYGEGALGVPGNKYQECVWRTAYYFKAPYEVDKTLVANAKERKRMEAGFTESGRTIARNSCTGLPQSEVHAAMDEADRIANAFPGQRFSRRPVLGE